MSLGTCLSKSVVRRGEAVDLYFDATLTEIFRLIADSEKRGDRRHTRRVNDKQQATGDRRQATSDERQNDTSIPSAIGKPDEQILLANRSRRAAS